MAAVSSIRDILQRTLRICASDGRVFIGTFVCVDKQLNIILTNTEEYRIGGSLQGRFVGMVMVPWRLALKVEVQEATRFSNVRAENDDSLYS